MTAAISVWQTYLSNVVGQRVMHDLRAAVYRHLQRMSLAFFTRTRTGEVQSRIANDIGGIDNVVTTTATSIAQNATTVIATSRRDVHPQLAAGGDLARVRAAVRAADPARRQGPAQDHDRAPAAARRYVRARAESLSVSGIMLGKTMGRGRDLADRFTKESKDIAELEVRSRMAGRWLMSTIQMTFAIQPAIVYWLAGQSFVLGSRSRSGPWSRSRRCRRGCCSRSSRCSASAPTWRPRSRCSTGSSSTSISQSTSSRRSTRCSCGPTSCSARSVSTTSPSATWPTVRTSGRCAESTSPFPLARGQRSSAKPAPARPRSATWWRGSTSPRRAG